jgi:polyphosphate kinase
MFYNRDLSWLGFNLRVLQEADNDKLPLFERLKFLSIFSANLDEFFRVRYPALVAVTKLSRKTQLQVYSESNENVLEKVQAEIHRHLELYHKVLVDELIPSLVKEGIYLYYDSPIKTEHLPEIKEIFLSKVLSFIQPLFLEADESRKFLPENNQLYLVVSLKEAGHATIRHAVINIPSDKLPRFFVLSCISDVEHVIFIDDIVRENISSLFPGFEIVGIYSIKLNRDAELHFDDDYSGNLRSKIEKQLTKREFGPPSRFLYEAGMPRNLQLFLATSFGVKHDEMFSDGKYHNLNDFAEFPTFGKKLTYQKWKPISPPNVMDSSDIFNVMNTKDILLHLPYESYNPVLSFFNQAAVDFAVTDIYITLYRVAADSHIVNALISAAKNGKKVTAFIELKARFDEANNIRWSKEMEEAGVTILYSIPNIKVHSKIGLIKKKTPEGVLCYSILSTGNFNETTARFYTDHVLMTTDPIITEELLQLFNFLEKKHKPTGKHKVKFESLYVSQFNIMDRFVRLIDREILKVKNGEPAGISIKVNNLEEQYIISLLYKASQQGVPVRLIVRSVCCLIPGVPGLSENITVRRIIDRYLEHSRIFIFGAEDNCEVIMGSADLMNRNLHSRIEVCVGIKDATLKKELVEYFNLQWSDNEKSVQLTQTMDHVQVLRDRDEPVRSAQESIYKYLASRT